MAPRPPRWPLGLRWPLAAVAASALLASWSAVAVGREIAAYAVEDSFNQRVQLCPAGGGPCTTVAGGTGQGALATQLSYPMDVALAPDGAYVIADTLNHRVQRCSNGAWGPCLTVAGGKGSGSAANQLKHPRSVTLNAHGEYIIADQFNHRIQLCPADGSGNCTTVIGEGDGQPLSNPGAVHLAPDGSYVIADRGNHRILRCAPQPAPGGADCATVAGGRGAGLSDVQFHNPLDVVLADNGDFVVADNMNHRVQRCPASGSGKCSTVAGGNGRGAGDHQLAFPRHVAVAPNGDYVVTDKLNHRVQRCPASGTGICTTVAGGHGDGQAANQLSYPDGVALVEVEIIL